MLRYLSALPIPFLLLQVSIAGEPEAIDALRKAGAIGIIDGNKKHLMQVTFSKKNHDAALLDAIVDCKELRQIFFAAETGIDDEAVAKLKNFPKLEQVDTVNLKLTDKAMEHLAACPNLKRLNLSGAAITDAAGAKAKKIEKLEFLVLNGAAVGDKFLADIADLPKLKQLQLGGTKVTDKGFESLAKMKSLDNVVLRGTKVTPDGVEKFRKDRPDVKVGYKEPRKK